jgi:hypothetical protein
MRYGCIEVTNGTQCAGRAGAPNRPGTELAVGLGVNQPSQPLALLLPNELPADQTA